MSTTRNLFPKTLPNVAIKKVNKPPFSIRCEEIAGWLFVPRLGDQSRFAFYDNPDQRYTGMHTMHAVREALIHGIACVQVDTSYEDEHGHADPTYAKFMRMTETHIAYVASMEVRDGTLHIGTFMDDDWLADYEVGEKNIGRAIHQEAKGVATQHDDGMITVSQEECPDIIGRYHVTLGARSYDTVALLEICEGIMTIQYTDAQGRTVLFRRYNRFNWKTERYGALWTDKLPDSEVLLVNGEQYVHWYDCISDYVL